MGLRDTQNQDMNLVLSTDAKPRLKWTPELHQRFVDAVIQLGGADSYSPNPFCICFHNFWLVLLQCPSFGSRGFNIPCSLIGETEATPKSLMRVMGIPGLTLYHLKSHLQKYRLGKNQPTETCSDLKQEDCKDNRGGIDLFSEETSSPTSNRIDESSQIAQAIHVQMEVQRKLHQQIEVQRHLQLRIEAQGKYLQKVLIKAQETLVAYTSSSMGVEHAKAELSQLVSMVSSGCSSSSLSELTEATALSLENPDTQIQIKGHGCSIESSLTSSETSDVKEDKELKALDDEEANELSHTPVMLPLLDQPWISHSSDQVLGRKRKGSIIAEDNSGDMAASKKLPTYREEMGPGLSKKGLLGTLDLNSQYQDEQDLGQTIIDLNSIGRI